MGYVADQKSQIHSEAGLMMPRLKAFATALTGDDAKSQALLRTTHHHLLSRASKERGHTPMVIWAFSQLHKIWISRMGGKSAESADPRLFQPRSRVNDGGRSARFAMRLAKLNAQQRGALHLVYGERLSYDEVAEIFEVEVAELMRWLSQCYSALGAIGAQNGAPASERSAPRQKQQGWAA